MANLITAHRCRCGQLYSPRAGAQLPPLQRPTIRTLLLLPQLNLVYLRSWSDIGRAEVTCLSGCRCNATQLEGYWERHATLTDLATMQVRAQDSEGRQAAHAACCGPRLYSLGLHVASQAC